VAGGLLSGFVMILLQKTGRFHIITVSVAGGIAHNMGQIVVAMVLLETRSLAWYLLVLWFAGLASGAVIGLVGGKLVSRLERKKQ
jgi:heptaprenyl diphosphate synthase